MKGNLPYKLLLLLNDRTHGATYIQERILEELSNYEKLTPSLLKNIAEQMRKNYPAMVQIHHLSRMLAECAERFEKDCVWRIKRSMEKIHSHAVEKCVKRIIKLKPSRITTISHSSQVVRVLIELRKKNLKFTVLVGEGKPAREGLETAKMLRKAGIRSYICRDENLSRHAEKRDLIIIGVDAFGKEWLTNKIGSYELVIRGALAGVPTVVCASEDKLVKPEIMNYRFDTDFLRIFKYEISEMQMELVPNSIVWKLIY